MIDAVMKIFNHVPPLGRRTRPNLSAAIGFLTGGIGLAVYFRSVVDFLIPIALMVAILVLYNAVGQFGWLPGAVLAGLYGYFRSENSNRRLAEASVPGPAPSPRVTP